jgi:hypothetical protein
LIELFELGGDGAKLNADDFLANCGFGTRRDPAIGLEFCFGVIQLFLTSISLTSAWVIKVAVDDVTCTIHRRGSKEKL